MARSHLRGIKQRVESQRHGQRHQRPVPQTPEPLASDSRAAAGKAQTIDRYAGVAD
jgi:hypothetical protein